MALIAFHTDHIQSPQTHQELDACPQRACENQSGIVIGAKPITRPLSSLGMQFAHFNLQDFEWLTGFIGDHSCHPMSMPFRLEEHQSVPGLLVA